STRSWLPSGLGKAWRMECTSRSGAAVFISSRAEVAFRIPVERMPKATVDHHDKQAHHGNAEHDAMEIARLRCSRNVSAEAISLQMLVSPGGDLRHDACVPGAA